ncbi:MAG: YhbY family RNA-binding protein [Clostridiales bacterium]|jgi:RNA-binding protein|nr:YhbY family RNA-binding protein [Clostridiales bacterium]
MLTPKQRKILEAKANPIDAAFQIGKGGITDNFVESLNDALRSRELVKISVLKNSQTDAKELIGGLAALTAAEAVAVRGGKIVLYKYSDKDGINHILQ